MSAGLTTKNPGIFGGRFLPAPDLFPARASGEPAGSQVINTRLAGVDYLLDGLSEEQRSAVENGFPNPEAPSSAPPDAESRATVIRFFRAFQEDFFATTAAEDFFDFDFQYSPGRVRIAGARCMVLIDLDPVVSAAAFLPSTTDSFNAHSRSVIANVFRAVAAYRILRDGGLLLHSSGLRLQAGAYLFSGHSGAGKTTLAREWIADGGATLSDDLNAAFIGSEGRWQTQAVPFSGRVLLSTPRAVDLLGVFRLRQGQESEVTSGADGQWVAALTANAPFVNADPYRFDKVVDRCQSIGVDLACGHVTRQRGDLSFLDHLGAQPND